MKYLGLDLGTKTIGIATGAGFFAKPWKTVHFTENDFQQAVTVLLPIISSYEPDEIILGYPLNMDGSAGFSAQRTLQFKTLLTAQLAKPITIILVDERKSTVAADSLLIAGNVQRKKRKTIKDQLAAAIILQRYFEQLKARKY